MNVWMIYDVLKATKNYNNNNNNNNIKKITLYNSKNSNNNHNINKQTNNICLLNNLFEKWKVAAAAAAQQSKWKWNKKKINERIKTNLRWNGEKQKNGTKSGQAFESEYLIK